MKFSKDLLGSRNFNIYKISAPYHAPFFKLIAVASSDPIAFCIGFLLTKNAKTLFFKTARIVFKFYSSNENL